MSDWFFEVIFVTVLLSFVTMVAWSYPWTAIPLAVVISAIVFGPKLNRWE